MRMKSFILLLFAAATLIASAAETSIKGYLVDISCAEEEGQKPGFGAKHTRDCLQMDECDKSGYGVLTDDRQVIRFDDAGNAKARKFIADLKKTNAIKVMVTGSMKGESMAVSKLELQ